MPSESRKAKCEAALRTVAASAVCTAVEISATWFVVGIVRGGRLAPRAVRG